MSLATEVSGVLIKARLLERALNGKDFWELQYGNQRHAVVPVETEHAIVWNSEFRSIPGVDTINLLCNGIAMFYFTIPAPPLTWDDKLDMTCSLGMGSLVLT